MLVILKTILALLLELLVCYLFGTFIIKKIIKIDQTSLVTILVGVLAYQIIFQLLTFGVYIVHPVLSCLSTIWIVILGATVMISLVCCRKEIAFDIKEKKEFLHNNRKSMFLLSIVILAVCYFVSINGEINDDAAYYIGLINTTLTTDSIYQYNVYNGYLEDSLYLRRMLVTFEVHGAVLCQIWKIPALVFARIFRACQNVLLTCSAVYLVGTELFNKDKKKINKAITFVIVFLYLQFMFVGTIYTTAAFFMTRTYEGKAFASNVVMIFILYLCMRFHRTKNKRFLMLILLSWWGSVAISASAMVLVPIETFVLLVPYYLGNCLKKTGEQSYK